MTPGLSLSDLDLGGGKEDPGRTRQDQYDVTDRLGKDGGVKT